MLEKTGSLNHSRLINRITYLLTAACEAQYDVLPELEFELSTGNFKPDVALITKQTYSWEQDVIRFPQPPITAIEILSPTQAFDAVASKIQRFYMPAGVRSAWLVLPFVRSIYLFMPDQPVRNFFEGELHDPATSVRLDLAAIFQART